MNKKLSDFIVPSVLENSDILNHKKFETKDLIYLDAVNDIKNPIEKNCYPSDYAIINSALQSNELLTNLLIKKKIENRNPCCYWLRTGGDTIYNREQVSIFCESCNISSIDASNNTLNPGLRPILELDIDAVLQVRKNSSKHFQIGYDGSFLFDQKVKYTMDFGEYPKTLVGEVLSQNLEKCISYNHTLLKTGRKYLGYYDKKQKTMVYHDEYEIIQNQDKYVRIKNPIDDNFFWLKVEPITWEIQNWDELPNSINPLGSGQATTIKLQTIDAINAGIPYYTNANDKYRSLWQNSTLRGYLNGLDMSDKNSTGNTKEIAENGGNFTESSFITEALSSKIEIIKNIKREPKKSNSWGVKISEDALTVDEQIKFYVETRKSFMLHGPSGIGKSRRIEEFDPDFISIVLRNGILPEEVIGKNIYPNNDKTKAGVWVPPAWYAELCTRCKAEPNKNHILFIDEITNVRPSEQSLVFHLVLNNSIGPNVGKLPKNVVVAAAGNSMKESEAAYAMPEPLFRRFEGHIELKPDIQQWLEWGNQASKKNKGRQKIHPLIASFVSTYGEKVFYSAYDSENPPKFAIDPRGWEQVSDIIYDNKGVLARELIVNKVGEQIASSLIEYAQTPQITLEDILNDNYFPEDLPRKFDARYALALSLRSVTMEQITTVREFVKRLGPEILSAFDVAWVNNDDEKALYLSSLQDKEIEIEL